MTGRADRTPERIERDRARSRAFHERRREMAAMAAALVEQRHQASGRRPDEPAGHLQQRPDAERIAELEQRIVELEARAAARESELIELRAYRQKNLDAGKASESPALAVSGPSNRT